MNNDVLPVILSFALIGLWIVMVIWGIRIAKRKNRSPHWMWFGLHPLGALIVLIVMATSSPLEVCAHCSKKLPQHARVCAFCGTSISGTGPAGAAMTLGDVQPADLVSGKFRKVKIRPISGYSQYRGQGSIQFDDAGILITGRHVLSMGARWGIAIAIVVGSLLVSSGSLAPGIIPLYFLMEYGWLKREETRVNLADLIMFAADPARGLIAIEFSGPNWRSPVVLNTPLWREAYKRLRVMKPSADAFPNAPGA
jgi:hypothetical protein